MKISTLISALAILSSARIISAASEHQEEFSAVPADIESGDNQAIEVVSGEEKHRELRYARNKIHWPECVEDKLSVAECKALIEKELGRGHLLSNVSIGLKYPEVDFAADFGFGGDFGFPIAGDIETGAGKDYYYRVAIPVNYMAQAHGYFVDGRMTFNKEWDGVGSGPREVGPWSCWGKDANQCCKAIKRTVRDRDTSNNFLDCWVQEQAPVPFHRGNRISYCAWEWNKNRQTYVAKEVQVWRQKKVMNHAKAKLADIIVPMVDQCLADGKCPYNKLDTMANNLHFHGRSVPSLQRASTDINAYLHRPNSPETVFPLDAKLQELLERVATELEHFVSAEFEVAHHIVIHAGDPAGSFVRHEPKIGTAPGMPECIPE